METSYETDLKAVVEGFQSGDSHEKRSKPQAKKSLQKKVINLDTPDKWTRAIRRLVRRAEIERLLSQDINIDELTKRVRQFEQEADIDKIINDLLTKEVITDPTMMKLSENLYNKLHQEFPEIKAIVLMGSAVHGGARVRQATRTWGEHDLDWGIIFDRPVKRGQIEEIINRADSFLPGLAQEMGFGEVNSFGESPFHSCRYVNPSYHSNYDILDVDQITDILSFYNYLSGFEYEYHKPEEIFDRNDRRAPLVYFQPSFPPEVNERNRSLVLAALAKLRKTNKETYLAIVPRLLTEWQMIHGLKMKHFKEVSKKRDRTLREKVQDSSGKMMSAPLKSAIEGTTLQKSPSPIETVKEKLATHVSKAV